MNNANYKQNKSNTIQHPHHHYNINNPSALHHLTSQRSTILPHPFSSTHYDTIQHNVTHKHNATQCNPIQHNVTQCKTSYVQYIQETCTMYNNQLNLVSCLVWPTKHWLGDETINIAISSSRFLVWMRYPFSLKPYHICTPSHAINSISTVTTISSIAQHQLQHHHQQLKNIYTYV